MTARPAAAVILAVLTLTGCSPTTAPAPFAAAAPTTSVSAARSWMDAATYPVVVDKAVKYAAVVDGDAHDGDTLTVIRLARTGPNTVTTERVHVRLAHIDTPELRGGTDTTRTAARAARDRLRDLAPAGAPATLYDLGPDKYGRTLAQVDVAGVNVGAELLREGHAKPYEGGTKS